MKSLFNAKRADLYLQLLALVAPFIWAMISTDSEFIFFAYFTVGAVQIISCLVNKAALDERLKSKNRRRYEKWLLVVFITFAVLLLGAVTHIEIIMGGMLLFAFAMLFVGAGMAIWYMSITTDELSMIRKLSRRFVI